MKVSCYSTFEHVPDPSVEKILLPERLISTSNIEKIDYYKRILQIVITKYLSTEERDLLTDYYWGELSKTQIANSRGVAISTILRRLKKIENKLEKHMEFADVIYKELNRGELS